MIYIHIPKMDIIETEIERKERLRIQASKYYYANRTEIAYKSYIKRLKNRVLKPKSEYKKRPVNPISREEYNIRQKKYYNQKGKKSYTCECGGKYTHHSRKQHLKTNKHQEFIKGDETPPPTPPVEEPVFKIKRIAKKAVVIFS